MLKKNVRSIVRPLVRGLIADEGESAPLPPVAPSAFQANQWDVTAGDGQLSFTINSLPYNGRSPLTDIEYKLGAAAWTSSGGLTNFAVPVSNGVSYGAMLRAVNAIDAGPDSDVKTRTPSAAATEPAQIAAGQWNLTQGDDHNSLRVVRNSDPNDGGSTIIDYEISVDGGSWVSVGLGILVNITGLTPDTNYGVRYRAVNAIDAGPASVEKIEKTSSPVSNFSVANQSITRGALTLQGHAAHSFNASGADPIASIGAPTGASVADLNISFVGGVVTVEPAGNGLPNGPYSITIPCHSGAGQSGEQVDVTYQIATEPNTFDIGVSDGLAALKSLLESVDRGVTIKLCDGDYNPTADDIRIRRSAAWNTALVYPANKADPRQGRDLTTGNLVKVTSRNSKQAKIKRLTIDDFLGESNGYRFSDLVFERPNDGSENSNAYILDRANGGGHDVVLDNCHIVGEKDWTFSTEQGLYSGVRLGGDNVTIQDNVIEWVAVGLNIDAGDNQSYIGNEYINCWEDAYKGGGGSNYYYCWNKARQKDGLDFPSPNNIHADFWQWIGPLVSVTNVNIVGNESYIGKTLLGSEAGQNFFQDNNADGARIQNLTVAGNFSCQDLVRGTTFQETDDAVIRNNTIINDMANLRNQTAIILQNQSGGVADATNPTVRDNVTHSVQVSQATGVDIANNNTSLDHLNDASYAALFADPQGGAALTSPRTQFAPLASGPLDVAVFEPVKGVYGPAGRNIIDFDNRTTDFPWAEDGFSPSATNLTGLDVDQAVTTAAQISGVSATGATLIVRGGNSATVEIRESDNTTVVVTGVPADEEVIIYSGQYYHISDTAASSGEVQTDLLISVGTQSVVWSYTTAAVVVAPSFNAVDGGADGIVRHGTSPAPNMGADSDGLTVSFSVNPGAGWDSGQYIVDVRQANSNTLLEVKAVSSGRMIFAVKDAANTSLCSGLTASNTFLEGNWYHVAIKISLSGSVQMFINGVENTSWGITPSPIAGTLSWSAATRYGICGSATSGGVLQGSVSEIWLDTQNQLDLATDLTKFRAVDGSQVDLGANGETPTGVSPALYFGNPANGFHTNLGSAGGGTLIGSFTDVAAP